MHRRGWHNTRPWYGLLVVLLICSPVYAQTVDVTAALEITDGFVRPGAYVPLTLRARNMTDKTLAGVRLSSGGPVDVVMPWRLAPGESGEKAIPVFCTNTNDDLQTSLEFTDASGAVVTRTNAFAKAARALADDAALIAFGAEQIEPDETAKESLRQALGAKTLHFVRLPPDQLALAVRCGVAETSPPLRFPLGATQLVQPEAYRLLATKAWPAEDRLQLWLWLAVFALAVLVAGVLVPRRRSVLAAVVLVAVAAGATAMIWFFAGVRRAEVREARIFVNAQGKHPAAEQLILIETRSGALGRFDLPQAGLSPLPRPVAAGSEGIFDKMGTLHYGGQEEFFETLKPVALLHTLGAGAPPVDFAAGRRPLGDLERVSRRADVVAALYVEGNRATDASETTLNLPAWSARWQADADADLAYAGRSLAWWDSARREGDTPALLVWWRDPLPPALAPSENRTRLPAMAICTPE